MENNTDISFCSDSDKETEEIESDNEPVEILALTTGKIFQTWDEALNFFTEYCHQKGFSYHKRQVENIEISLGISHISKRTLKCSHSSTYKSQKINDSSR